MSSDTPATALDLGAIKARAAAASEHWSMGSHAHPVKGCRCGSCWQPATLSQPGGLFCDDVGEREHDGIGDPDEGDRCDQFGYTWPDAEFIVHARADVLALLAELAEVTRQRDEAHVTIRAFVDDLDGGEWATEYGVPFMLTGMAWTDDLGDARMWAANATKAGEPAVPISTRRVWRGSPIVSASAVDVDPPETTP